MVPAPPTPLDTDYQAIENAVMETARGRWFLAEYARRHRHAETERLLEAMARMQAAIEERLARPLPAAGSAHLEPIDPRAAAPVLAPASREEVRRQLDHAMRIGTQIVAVAERVQETSWTLREQGVAPGICDRLEQGATEIYAACAGQDERLSALLHLLDEQPASEPSAGKLLLPDDVIGVEVAPLAPHSSLARGEQPHEAEPGATMPDPDDDSDEVLFAPPPAPLAPPERPGIPSTPVGTARPGDATARLEALSFRERVEHFL